MKIFDILLEKSIYDDMIDMEMYLNDDLKQIRDLFWINTICIMAVKTIGSNIYDIGDEVNDIMLATNIAQKYDLLPKEFLYQFTKFISIIKHKQKAEITEHDLRDVFKNLNIHDEKISPSFTIFKPIKEFLSGSKTLEDIRPIIVFFVKNYNASDEFKKYSKYFFTK